MKAQGLIARAAVGALGGVLLIGGASAALAAEVGSDDVEVDVNIEAIPPVGALTMSIAPGGATLTEVESGDDAVRQFNGKLPTVTVTDDREAVPENVYWYVTGQAGDLAGPGGAKIGPENLGWDPLLITDGGENSPVVEGPEVDTALDDTPNNVGIGSGVDFLALSLFSDAAAAIGSWQANADLFLKTPADVTPGAYSGTITLTLWEEDIEPTIP